MIVVAVYIDSVRLFDEHIANPPRPHGSPPKTRTMTRGTFLCFLSLIVTLCLAVPWKGQGGANKDLEVCTSSGKIHGMIHPAFPHVRQFLGIPFAQPPIGALRWMPPRPLPPSAVNSKIEATQLPPSCIQYLSSSSSIYSRDVLQFNLDGLNRTGSISEDCLTASIWTPTEGNGGGGGGTGLPVLLFIYGGGFTTGGQDVPYQLPPQWVERTKDHIVVSFK